MNQIVSEAGDDSLTVLPKGDNRPLRVLFFCRGRGHGHAIPDMEIVASLRKKAPQISVIFVSYATGATTLRRCGYEVLDLALPELPTFIESLVACSSAIRSQRPDVVLSHEEFAAITASALADLPSIFLSAWLPPANSVAAESLQHAKSLIIIENPGLFPVPPHVRSQVHFVGPIIRKMEFTVKDRSRIRSEQGVSPDAVVIVVAPGGWGTETREPIGDIVLSAFLGLPYEEKRLQWIAADDSEDLKKRCEGMRNIEVLPFQHPIERFLAAADVILTKGTRGITLDSAAVGVPSISLSSGQNPIDDVLVPRIHSNIALNAQAVTPEILANYIQQVVACGLGEPLSNGVSGAELAADVIVADIASMA